MSLHATRGGLKSSTSVGSRSCIQSACRFMLSLKSSMPRHVRKKLLTSCASRRWQITCARSSGGRDSSPHGGGGVGSRCCGQQVSTMCEQKNSPVISTCMHHFACCAYTTKRGQGKQSPPALLLLPLHSQHTHLLCGGGAGQGVDLFTCSPGPQATPTCLRGEATASCFTESTSSKS